MGGNEAKMICQELKALRKEVSGIEREIFLTREEKKREKLSSELYILVMEDGKPKYVTWKGEYYRLEPVEKPPLG